MEEKQIDFDIKVDNVKMDFIDAMDIITIFGNLFDNAIEACDKIEKDKKIFVNISVYHEMISIRMENDCTTVKWKTEFRFQKRDKNMEWAC